jgi:hypothetical protein
VDFFSRNQKKKIDLGPEFCLLDGVSLKKRSEVFMWQSTFEIIFGPNLPGVFGLSGDTLLFGCCG